jgi:hypothetical protein
MGNPEIAATNGEVYSLDLDSMGGNLRLWAMIVSEMAEATRQAQERREAVAGSHRFDVSNRERKLEPGVARGGHRSSPKD